MPRDYVRPLGARKYTVYCEDTISAALKEYSEGSSFREVSEKYGISIGTLHNKVSNLHKGRVGHPTCLTAEDEVVLVENIVTAAEFGFPCERRDLQWMTTSYLKSSGKTVPVFKNNVPGTAWVESFMRRHASKLSGRLCQSSGKNKTGTTPEVLIEYFRNVKEAIEGVPPSNVINYDETNLSDKPGRKNIIFKRGAKYPERILDESKAAVSLMLAGSADGKLFTPYVCYKAQGLYSQWRVGGPRGTKYNSSNSGWIEGYVFEDWFVSCLLPQIEHLPGKKVIIGDQLSTHFNDTVLELCRAENIVFVCLPANCTHILQPLDVCFFAYMKKAWRRILKDHMASKPAEESCQKKVFPPLLKQLWAELKDVGKKNLRSAFEACLDEKKCIAKISSPELVA